MTNLNLEEKTAAVIGCGGLGCNIITHLAGMGIGRLFICDFDVISESNLNRQFLYRKSDLGKEKSFAAAENLKNYSNTEIIPFNTKIETTNDLQFAKDADLILLAVDNNETRAIVNEFCTKNQKPLICGGIDGLYGMAYLYVPGFPCLDCAGLTLPASTQASISPVAGVIGSLEADLAFRYFTGEAEALAGKLMVYDNAELTHLPIAKRKDCRFCKETK